MTHFRTSPPPETSAPVQELNRVLSLRDLIFYGVVAVSPTAFVTIFGLACSISRGHACLTILLGMIAILFTAISYGRMASLYPAAGSAYTYVSRGLNAYLGFLTGWAMLLDYVVIPLFCIIFASLSVQRLMPNVPYIIWAFVFAATLTGLNISGIQFTARINMILLAFMGAILVAFEFFAIRYIVHMHGVQGLFSLAPFFNRPSFSIGAIASATSFSALMYLGFDSVTTLAEEVHDPRRNVLRAVVAVCLFTGIFGGLFIYLGQLVWPDYTSFPRVETAFMDVTRRVGGILLFEAMGLLLVVANLGSGLTSQVGAARLLFGLGRDRILPPRVFAHIDHRLKTPTYNVALLGAVAFVGSLFLSYELTAELLNFGAFLGFMGVNLAAIRQFYFRGQNSSPKNFLGDFASPFLGFLFCLAIWVGLSRPAKIAGGVWFIVGLTYLAFQSHGFRIKPAIVDFREVS